MDREQARQAIQARATEYLKPDHSRKGFECPICGSGSGKNGTGITTKDGVHFTCWAGCFTNSDIIDIIGKQYDLTEYNDKLHKAAEIFNITIDGGRSTMPGKYQKQDEIKQPTQSNIHNNTYTTQQEPDYTEFLLQAYQDIGKTDYHRGLTDETLSRFRIGYVENWKHPKAPKMVASPRLIIPTSKYSYLARHASDTDFINYRGQVENKSKVGKVRIFNWKALQQNLQPIFVVEGEIDAMSICDVGGEALGMGSKSNVDKLLSMMEKHRPQQPIIIALDNEKEQAKQDGVEKSVREIEEGLDKLGIIHYREDIASPYKDANEALMADREAFKENIQRAIEKVSAAEEEAIEAEREALRRESVASYLPNFIKGIEDSNDTIRYSTGFDCLDTLLDGGLYAGLYCIGAISSLGKTTFCQQVTDQIAAAGYDVLIFSLEMARNELIAKSISRNTLIKDFEIYGSTIHAKTTRGILTGPRYADYTQEERDIISKAVEAYGEYAKNIYITEGIGDVGIEQVREKVANHIRVTGKPPIVLIDYLQILAPADARATDKQNTDKAVLELKRMSRDYGIPVIGISSFNRDNYNSPVNLASFKESGAIEYSSDVLIGLQYYGMDYQEGESDGARQKRIRELTKEALAAGKAGKPQQIQVKILKNRNGSKGDTVLDFYPMFNYFLDASEAPTVSADGSSGGWTQASSSYGEQIEVPF